MVGENRDIRTGNRKMNSIIYIDNMHILDFSEAECEANKSESIKFKRLNNYDNSKK